MKKLVIEVRMNEAASKAANPNVPYTPEEIVADAVACARAGAAVVHFHARNADATESSRTDDFRAVIEGIRDQCDVLVHPTLGRFREGLGSDSRTAHLREMIEQSNLRPDIAPLDLGSNNLDMWDPAARQFIGDGFVYRNTTLDLRQMATQLTGWGITPQLAIWSVPALRLMGAMMEAGYLPEPAYPVLFLSSERFLAGHPATSLGLRAFLDAMPAGKRVEWSVLVHGQSMLAILPEVIGLGGHVSIGLGDHSYAELGQPGNAQLVERVVEVARLMGREIATPEEARDMLGTRQWAQA